MFQRLLYSLWLCSDSTLATLRNDESQRTAAYMPRQSSLCICNLGHTRLPTYSCDRSAPGVSYPVWSQVHHHFRDILRKHNPANLLPRMIASPTPPHPRLQLVLQSVHCRSTALRARCIAPESASTSAWLDETDRRSDNNFIAGHAKQNTFVTTGNGTRGNERCAAFEMK